MSNDFDEGFKCPQRDRVDAAEVDFDWHALYERLNEDATSGENDPELARAVLGFLQLLIPSSPRRIRPESLGMRLIALAWVLSPGYFEGTPSVSQLAKRCSIRVPALANYTGYYSRLLKWRNRGQQHAWNWQRQGTPSHRGALNRRKLMRNVPPFSGQAKVGPDGTPDSGAVRRRGRPRRQAAGSTLSPNGNEREQDESE